MVFAIIIFNSLEYNNRLPSIMFWKYFFKKNLLNKVENN